MGLRTTIGAAVVLAGLGAPAFALEAPEVVGSWRNSDGGNCENAYFRAEEAAETVRGEEAIRGVVANEGIEVPGLVILDGARRGQMVSPESDMAVFLMESLPGQLHLIPIGEPVLSWPEVTLEMCP